MAGEHSIYWMCEAERFLRLPSAGTSESVSGVVAVTKEPPRPEELVGCGRVSTSCGKCLVYCGLYPYPTESGVARGIESQVKYQLMRW